MKNTATISLEEYERLKGLEILLNKKVVYSNYVSNKKETCSSYIITDDEAVKKLVKKMKDLEKENLDLKKRKKFFWQ